MKASIMRLLLYLSFILVTGCSSTDPSGTNNSSNISGNQVVFNPSTGDIPLPNVLATATAKDPITQYVNASGSVVARPANTPMTPPEALAYVNLREVGNTNAVAGVNAPIYIRFTSPVDAATVTAANIKVFQITPDSSSSSATENNPLGFSDVTGMFTLKYTAGSTDLFLFPNFPMLPGTRYLYMVSNRVKDVASGTPVVSSAYFDMLKSKYELVGPFAALEAIRANVMSGANIKFSGYAKVMDDLITAAKAASRDEIALMGRFITTGAGFTPTDATNSATMIPVESALRSFAAGAALGGLPGKTWTNTFSGVATLPPAAYWGAIPGAGTAPATVSSVVTGSLNSAELSIDPVVATANAATMDLNAVAGAYNPAAGVVQGFRSGANLTGFYHVPRTVPFVYLTPTAPNVKVIFFQHGITGQKEQVVAVAGSLTAAGYAVMAIDLPLHGALAVTGHATGDLWGQDFMAVGAPLATRSNIQQAAFNLHRLELSLKTGALVAAGVTGAPPTEIKYVSLSLGSIVGAYYLAGNTTLNSAGSLPLPYNQTTLNSDMKGFLSVPGGRTAYLIQNSPSFSPSVNAGLAAKGVVTGSPTYHNFFQVTQSVVDPVDPATMTTPLASGLPSRLSGRIAIQEAVGDTVIPNDNTRYFGNALGGREVLGAAGAAVGPAFKQLGYRGAATARIPSSFMLTLTGGVPAAKTDFAALNASGAAAPSEGYFQFDQAAINHGFLIDPRASAANTGFAQSQMVQYLLYGGIVDPTSGAGKQVIGAAVPSVANDIRLPAVLKIFGY
ncbi:MAG: hypothetical protein HY888_07900 [Deltaproteobacteria bacterium]|nr:hypothetical protein [Deltaproteobacteria bacterium]